MRKATNSGGCTAVGLTSRSKRQASGSTSPRPLARKRASWWKIQASPARAKFAVHADDVGQAHGGGEHEHHDEPAPEAPGDPVLACADDVVPRRERDDPLPGRLPDRRPRIGAAPRSCPQRQVAPAGQVSLAPRVHGLRFGPSLPVAILRRRPAAVPEVALSGTVVAAPGGRRQEEPRPYRGG